MEGVQAFILSMKRESQNKAYTESPTKNIENLSSTIKRFTLHGFGASDWIIFFGSTHVWNPPAKGDHTFNFG